MSCCDGAVHRMVPSYESLLIILGSRWMMKCCHKATPVQLKRRILLHVTLISALYKGPMSTLII